MLIIEDHEESQIFFKEFSKSLGNIELLQAFNVEDWEIMFEENKDSLDIIVCDWNLPNKSTRFSNAKELAKYIRESFNWIMVSITNDDEIRDEFIDMKFDYIALFKNNLYSIVKEILRKEEESGINKTITDQASLECFDPIK